MEDISKIYNSLSDANKTNLTELLFGKQGGSQGTALIQAFQSGQIQNALDTTLHANGSAMKKQERWLESLEAKTRQFEAAFIRQGFLLAEVEETEKTKNISAYFII